MKHLLTALLFISFFSNSLFANQDVDFIPAQVIKVESNQMFPVETIRLTVKVPCGLQAEKFEEEDFASSTATIGVLLPNTPVYCLAMPHDETFMFSVTTFTPIDLTILGVSEDTKYEWVVDFSDL
ncbi:MAG: hypothetical protein ISR65_09360 [Bacteriovoracaceae bacterium]|nr:hypothetical protein [Bacteriovoracaceae bacterium]